MKKILIKIMNKKKHLQGSRLLLLTVQLGLAPRD